MTAAKSSTINIPTINRPWGFNRLSVSRNIFKRMAELLIANADPRKNASVDVQPNKIPSW